MEYYLPRHLSFCDCAGQIVFLDISRDRYFQLSPALEHALRALMNGRPAPGEDVDKLFQLGLIVNDHAIGEPLKPIAITPPTQSAIEDNEQMPTGDWRTTLDVARRVLQTKMRLRANSIYDVFEQVACAKAKIHSHKVANIRATERLAVAFDRARSLVPIKSTCLPDSLALIDLLFSRGLTADLVIAVSVSPFQAHCWAQAQNTLLNAPLDHALTFTPIRTI